MGKKRNTPSKQESPPELAYIVPELRPLAVPIDSVQLDPANENKHDDASVAAIAASLNKYQQRTPIVVNRATKFIAKGNGTWQAARKNGWPFLAVVWVDDDPRAHTGYRLADNRTAQLSEFDPDKLALSIATLQADDADFYQLLQLDALEASLPAPASDPPAVAVPEHYGVLIECKDEGHQKVLFERLKKEGLTVKVQTL